jgi:hypothetical protein
MVLLPEPGKPTKTSIRFDICWRRGEPKIVRKKENNNRNLNQVRIDFFAAANDVNIKENVVFLTCGTDLH